jgi:hypothetical protein
MPRKTPPWPSYPAWTTAKYWAFIRSGIRAKWGRWPPKFEALQAVRRNKPKTKKGRHKFEFKCSQCGKWFMQKEVEVDHIEPTGSLNCYEDLPGFVERMFVPSSKLRVVCKPCHRKITNEARSRTVE